MKTSAQPPAGNEDLRAMLTAFIGDVRAFRGEIEKHKVQLERELETLVKANEAIELQLDAVAGERVPGTNRPKWLPVIPELPMLSSKQQEGN